jgi:uncharacterized membrane protein
MVRDGEPPGRSPSRADAQARADRIRAFKEELIHLERGHVLILPPEERLRLDAHHDRILQGLARQFDVDTTDAQKQMSWGMRIASFLGALAFCAAAFFFCYRFWGLLSTPAQVGLLSAAPLLALGAAEYASRKERTLYFAGIVLLVALACFVLNLIMLGAIFNVKPTHNALLPWAAFAFVVAYTYGLRLLLAGGILCLLAYMSATLGTWRGLYWISFGMRPENFILPGLLLFAVPLAARHRGNDDFPAIYRLFGLLAVFLPILVLANFGEASYLLLPDVTIERSYQVLGFILAGLAIWAGIHRRWREVTNLGCTLFVILLYTKFFDWWWVWMPKYLFFLILGLIAIGLLVLLRKLRVVTVGDAS